MEYMNLTSELLEDLSCMTDEGNTTSLSVTLRDISNVIDIFTICIELPVLCWTTYALYRQVKSDPVMPVYVINLLFSDFIQIIGRLIKFTPIHGFGFILFIFGLFISVRFMVCIALERYILVVHPLWYRCRRTVKLPVFVSLAVWVFDVFYLIVLHISDAPDSYALMGYTIVLVLPIPILVYCTVATYRALYLAISVPHEQKKRIMGILAFVLLLYLVLTFPIIFYLFILTFCIWGEFHWLIVFEVTLYCSPLIDCFLYVLMKKDAGRTLNISQCSWGLRTHRLRRERSAVPVENITGV